MRIRPLLAIRVGTGSTRTSAATAGLTRLAAVTDLTTSVGLFQCEPGIKRLTVSNTLRHAAVVLTQGLEVRPQGVGINQVGQVRSTQKN